MVNLTVFDILNSLKSRESSSLEITKYYLNRIEQYDRLIDSFITVCQSEALNAARVADQAILRGESRPFLGVPYAVKDNICTKGITTTCASKILENFVPPYNATVLDKLSGAVLLGKLNMDEFGMGYSTENSYFKCTKNPFDFSKVPGGSSGGAAAAVSSGLAPFALASDTGGSVRQPASFCGCVGLKPTYGRVSRYGLVSYASSFDQIGVITKNVRDCAIVLNEISGRDLKDATTVSAQCDFINNFDCDIKGLRIGIPTQYFESIVDAEIKDKLIFSIKILEKLGAKCEEFSFSLADSALSAYYIIASCEASSNLARYDGVKYGLRACGQNLEQMYKNTRHSGFGREVKRRIMLGNFALSAGFKDEYYNMAIGVQELVINEFDKQFGKYDVLVTPTTLETAFKLGEKKRPAQMYMSDICTVAANLAGIPAISIPCGTDSTGMPIGIQIMGKRFDEQTVLNLAYALEQELNLDIKPSLPGESK